MTPSRSRCLDAALALTRVGRARRLPRPRPLRRAVVALAAVARRRPPAPPGAHAAARALAARRAAPLPPPPSADPQGAGDLRLGRRARAPPHRRRSALASSACARSSCSTPTARAGPRAWGYHWDMQTRWSFYPAGSPNVVVTAFAASGLLEAASHGARRPRATARAEAARWVLDELVDRAARATSPTTPGGPSNIHNANLLGAWLVHVAGGRRRSRRRARGPRRRADARRPAPRRLVALRRGPQPGLGRLLPLGLRPDLPRPAARRRSAHRRGGRARRRALPRVLRRGAAARSSGRTSRFPRMRTRPAPASRRSSLLLRRGLVERELLERVAQRVLDAGLRRRTRGASSLPAAGERPCATCAGATPTSRSGSSTPRPRCGGEPDLAPALRRRRLSRESGLGDATQRRMHAVVLATLVERLRTRPGAPVAELDRRLDEQSGRERPGAGDAASRTCRPARAGSPPAAGSGPCPRRHRRDGS